ncbi:hypothetical protein EMIT079MI2_100116 [Bacillus sp. IT-79MI2]
MQSSHYQLYIPYPLFPLFIILTEKTPSSKRSEGGGSSIRKLNLYK